ncbi:MAG: glutamate synthase large subunit [Bacillota bacterium]
MEKYMPTGQGLYDPHFEHEACGIGFVVNINGVKSHIMIRRGLDILKNLDHRGARGADPDTGDGAGIMMQIPHEFFCRECAMLGFMLPKPLDYAAGMFFFPQDPGQRAECERKLAGFIEKEGQVLLGWRTVPVNDGVLSASALATKPFIRQVFIARNPGCDLPAFERKLYVIRKQAEHAMPYAKGSGIEGLYAVSLSARTIVYKGMLTPGQLADFYTDFSKPDMESAMALVHSRFSTNTFPSWERAHPNRYIVHNGEINTLRGNVNWMYAREPALQSGLFGGDIGKTIPVISPDGSDSAIFDECLEFLTLTGRSLPHAVMMMIPESWSKHEGMSPEMKSFYEYHSCLMEPWDGPAAIAFSDGVVVGAVLDRNGLRPARYYITKDDLVILASEVGVLEIPPEQVAYKGRLQSGRMLLIDTEKKQIIHDEQIKGGLAAAHPYGRWLEEQMVKLEELAPAPELHEKNPGVLLHRQKVFGYTYEEQRLILAPMARDAEEPVGAMGMDAPLAVLSRQPQLLFNYFKQLFAQVTNPPIDAIREEIVISTENYLGSEGNLLEPKPESCRRLKINAPILSSGELAKVRQLNMSGLHAATIPILFRAKDGGAGLEKAMDSLYDAVRQEIRAGAGIIILSDRGVTDEMAPIPSLLAVSGLHHYLIREKIRTRVSLILESGEPRETHHFALLLGYGASAVNPYLVFDILECMVENGAIKELDYEHAEKNYRKAAVKGIVKILSKMGISTIQSYQGAQIFEAVGLNHSVIDRYFTWTPSRIGGIGMEEIARETVLRHFRAYFQRPAGTALDSGGVFQWRAEGEDHLYNPETIYFLQQACRNNDYGLYKNYAGLINDQTKKHYTLRGLLDFKAARRIPLAEVEPVESICRRFKTGAMSFGSISREAHECLAVAMNRLGGKSNTGEGGEDPDRFVVPAGGDSKCSAIKQVASGRFGVTSAYLASASEIQIKIAQGAKPGEGGQLPGRKVYPWIAMVRHSTPGVGLISPPPHHDIYSIEDLAELIHDLKNANPGARISVKLVSEVGVGTVAAGVAKGRADVILISGYDGGTGASPRTSIRHAGLPWELGLAETHQTLLLNNLRGRVILETDGKLMTGRDIIIAAMLGAEEFGFSTLPLVSMGCVMMRACNLDTCPVGIATQNPELRCRFSGKPEHVINLMHFLAEEMREIMAELGFRMVDEVIGRTDMLEPQKNISHWKAKTIDLSGILFQPIVTPGTAGRYNITRQHHSTDSPDSWILLDLCRPALEKRQPVHAILPIRNINRAVGTTLGYEITKRYGSGGLPVDTIRLHFTGSAGQSFGAFIPKGMTLILEGDANDYIGKGLSGGRIVVYPPAKSSFKSGENVVIGNVAFYGATSGEAFVNGMAGERFCVRNSGINAVVEAVGDHGCEYMTGGRVIVLGSTGRNFAAGMSGGIAFVFDEKGLFPEHCNLEMVDLEALADGDEIAEVKDLIRRHAEYTGSEKAKQVLSCWMKALPYFVKVIPSDYKRALNAMKKSEKSGMSTCEVELITDNQNMGA